MKIENLIYRPIPEFMKDYPEVAQNLEQVRLTFYCMNCQRKRSTTFITPNFGPLCYECVGELEKVSYE